MSNPKYTVVTTMKNEGPYILEWVAHHKALGFTNIIVATNDSTDPTLALLTRLDKLGEVKVHKTLIRKGGIQLSALRQTTRGYDEALEADWLYICDADEFLNIKVGDGRVDDLLAASSDHADIISIPWRIFGPSGIVGIHDKPVCQEFLYRENYDEGTRKFPTGKFMKSIYRHFDKYKRPGLHAPVPRPDLEEPLVTELPNQAQNALEAFNTAQVNHYALRSLDSYLLKRDRGRANHSSHTLGLDYWHRFNLSHQFDNSISRYSDAIDNIVSEYRADPELDHLHRLSVEWHKERAARLRSDPELHEMIDAMEKTNFIEPKDNWFEQNAQQNADQ